MADAVNNGIVNSGSGNVTVNNSTFGGTKEKDERKDGKR